MMSVEELKFGWIEDIAPVGQIREIILGWWTEVGIISRAGR